MQNKTPHISILANFMLVPLLLMPAKAQDKGVANNRREAINYTQWPRQNLLEQGTYSLRYGRRLENAISSFAELEKREPQNARWKTLLACAKVQRAYTITRAMEDAKVYKTPEEHYKYWADLRKKIYSMENSPIPDPPPVPRTRDDNQLFTQKPEVAAARIAQLSVQAIALLEDATVLAVNEPPEVQAELSHLKGWALLALWRDPRRSVPGSWPKKEGKEKGPERIVEALEQAVKLQPDNSFYLQSLSDGCILAASASSRFDEALHVRGTEAFRKFLPERSRKAEHWFRLGYLESRGSFAVSAAKLYPPNPFAVDAPLTPTAVPAGKNVLAKDAETFSGTYALERAATLDPSNPLYQYILAAVRLGEGNKTGMIKLIEAGNAGTLLLPEHYAYAASTVFAWMFAEPDRYVSQSIRYLCKGVSDMRNDKDAYEQESQFRRGIAALRGLDNKYKEALTNPRLSAEDKDVFLGHEMSFSAALNTYSPDK